MSEGTTSRRHSTKITLSFVIAGTKAQAADTLGDSSSKKKKGLNLQREEGRNCALSSSCELSGGPSPTGFSWHLTGIRQHQCNSTGRQQPRKGQGLCGGSRRGSHALHPSLAFHSPPRVVAKEQERENSRGVLRTNTVIGTRKRSQNNTACEARAGHQRRTRSKLVPNRQR